MTSFTDRIERQVLLDAPVSRVWKALSNAEEFGNWFGAALKGKTFEPGKHTRGAITYPGYEHLEFDALVERMEPEQALSFRWNPDADHPDFNWDYDPANLVEFEINEVDGGTLLTVVESGFDSLSPARRQEIYKMNSGGWDEQMRNIEKHLAVA
jgi:uncharacterized protein YndB with AHSA1/START domain